MVGLNIILKYIDLINKAIVEAERKMAKIRVKGPKFKLLNALDRKAEAYILNGV